ncbi:MAG: hypothetical protein JWN44_601 [Myxococcales bacterium]|nr:hypothetical protein [Myxococcales bacterium]
MERGNKLWLLAATIIVASNLVDATLTLCAVEFGDAVEANPLMDALLSHGVLQFVIVKHLLVSLGVILLWRFRERPLAVCGTWLILPVYPALVFYELTHCFA